MDQQKNKRSRWKRAMRFTLRFFALLIFLPLLLLTILFVVLQLEPVQKIVAGKTAAFLEQKIQTRVTLERIRIGVSGIAMRGLYIEDKNGDTLLRARSLGVQFNPFSLMNKTLFLSRIRLSDASGNIVMSYPDTLYNFDFIVSAFAGEPTDDTDAITDTSEISDPWKIDIRKVILRNVRFNYSDTSAGIALRAKVGSFETDATLTDVSELNFALESVVLKNSAVDVVMTVPLQDDPVTDTSETSFAIKVAAVTLQNVSANYKDHVSATDLVSRVGYFYASKSSFDLLKQEIYSHRVELDDSFCSYTQHRVGDPVANPINDTNSETSSDWKLKNDEILLSNNEFIYDDWNSNPVKAGMDYSHLRFKEISLDAGKFLMDGMEMSGRIHAMAFTEKSGFQLNSLKAKARFGNNVARLTDLQLQTPNSKITRNFGLTYASIDELASAPEKIGLTIDLEKTSVGLRDVRFFAPQLFNDSLIRNGATGKILLDGIIVGNLNDLKFKDLVVRSPGASLRLSGSVAGLMNPEQIFVNITTAAAKVNKSELFKMIPASLVESSIRLPDTLNLEAWAKGYIKNFDAGVNLATSSGNMNAEVRMNPSAGNKLQPYSATITSNDLHVGTILKNPMLGKFTLHTTINGSGFDTSDLNTRVDLVVTEAGFNNYTYKNLGVNGHFLKSAFTGTAGIDDKNIAFDFSGHVNIDPAHTQGNFSLSVKGADLRALNFSKEDLRISTNVESDIVYIKGRNPEGILAVRNVLLLKEDKKYKLDSLVVRALPIDSGSRIKLDSDILDASLTGNFLITDLPSQLTKHLNTYFQITGVNDTIFKHQDVEFKLNLSNPAMLTSGLVPGLSQLNPLTVKGNFNNSERSLQLDVDAPRIVYAGNAIDSLKMKIRTDATDLRYSLDLVQFTDSTLKFENIFFGGSAAGDSAFFQLSTAKDDSTKVLSLAGSVNKAEAIYQLRLDPTLVLNSENWSIDPANLLEFGSFYAENVTISKGSSAISLNSTERRLNAPVEVKFKEFELTTFSKIVEADTGLVKGNINGFVQVESQSGSPAFKSDLVINDFVLMSSPLGNISLKADNYEDFNRYDIDFVLKGSGNDMKLTGAYHAGDNQHLNMALDVPNLNLVSIQPFTAGQVTRMSGSVNGGLKVSGNLQKPVLNGELNFKDAALNPNIIHSYLRIPSGVVKFENDKIRIPGLLVYDTLNKEARIKGTIDIRELTNPAFDLDIHTDDFLAMNTDKRTNPLYYGRIFLRSDIKVGGNLNLPVLDVTAKLNKGSYITYVMPESEAGKDEARGIVEFTDSLNKHSDIMSRQDSVKEAKGMEGIELQASITVDRSVDIKMIVDPLAGDSVFLKGGGRLDFGLDRTGQTSLTGRYSINEGGYYLTITDFVKRDFKIGSGSSVTWSGDVLDAYLDLEAIYRVKASPIDLMQAQVSGLSELEQNKYRNLLTFDVHLKMSGFISSPEIKFDIQLAPEDRGALNGEVNSRLAQIKEDETQLNKQVFALLTLKRFIGENPLDGGGDAGLSSASRSSASKLLTQQLNTLSDRYVNFVDLDVGVNSYEDYSSGRQEGRTQVQVGVSKQIFNDRVTIRVGGNVDVEGEKAKQNNANDVAGNISIDYKLTEDGRYKLKAFRENQYENPIEGELTKTGAGFVFTRDFNRFKNLFRKPRRENDTQRKK